MQIVPNWCEKCEFDERDGGDEPCVICTVCGDNKPTQFKPKKPPSNAARIRAMTDEELDKFLGDVQWDVANYCGGVTQKQEYPFPEQRGAWLDWLREEAID